MSYLVQSNQYSWLKELGIKELNSGVFDGNTWSANGLEIEELCPSNNKPIAKIKFGSTDDYNRCITETYNARKMWADLPAPYRGEIVRQIGDRIREKKDILGKLLSLEVGKIYSEGKGEIQEVIDICDFATGLSRMFNGSTFPSERKNHLLMEQWNPLGVVGVISAFNFPAAVFGWNMSLALICGNSVIWKGAPTTNLTTIAMTNVIADVFRNNNLPASIVTAVCGGADVGAALAADRRVALLSFTGSCDIGAKVIP